jgi:hypothetical protein
VQDCLPDYFVSLRSDAGTAAFATVAQSHQQLVLRQIRDIGYLEVLHPLRKQSVLLKIFTIKNKKSLHIDLAMSDIQHTHNTFTDVRNIDSDFFSY